MLALFFFLVRSAIYVLISGRVNAVHVGDLVLWPIALLVRISRPRTAVVITAYGLDILYGSRSGLLPAIYRLYLSLGVICLSEKLRVIAISTATANLCRSIGFQNVTVVPLGVADVFEKPIPVKDANEQYVLFVGRLVKRKGAAWFAENVLPLLPSTIKMKVVGKVWDESELSVLRKDERVEYLGVVSNEELKRLRKNATAVLMPNIPTGGNDIEGFGLTALEAVADGGVLVASGIEGILDAVVDRQTGFLLPPQAAPLWEEKIRELMEWSETERIEFVNAAQEMVKARFSWERVAQDTMRVYQ